MISYLFIALLGFGFLSIGSPKSKVPSFGTTLLFIASLAILYLYYTLDSASFNRVLSYKVMQYQNLFLSLDLGMKRQTYNLYLPFLTMLPLALLMNLMTSKEDSARLNGLMFVNMGFLLFLACSNNLLMLLLGEAVIGIIGLYILNDYESKKIYLSYNLTADMLFFTAFCLLYGTHHTVELKVLLHNAMRKEYSDLALVLFLLGVFIKVGMFLFQNQVFTYKNVSFNRQLFLNFCVTPASAFVLLYKMNGILIHYEYYHYWVWGFAIATVLYGVSGALIYDNIKEKALCLNMLMWSFSLVHLSYVEKLETFDLGWMIFLFFCLNFWLNLIMMSFSGENYISKMGGVWKKLLPTLLLGGLLMTSLLHRLITYFMQSTNEYVWIGLEIGALMIIFATWMRQIFFGPQKSDERVFAFLKNSGKLSWIFILGVIGGSVYTCPTYHWSLLVVVALMIGLVWIYPLAQIEKFYEVEEIQFSEFFARLYDVVIVTPINVLGRVLWLTVDFLLIERTIINSLSQMLQFLIRISQKIHTLRIYNYIMTTLAGLMIIGFVLWRK